MATRRRRWISFAVVILLAPVTGCGGDGGDDDRKKREAAEKAIDGTFVGKVSGTKAFVAVVASPAERGKEKRDVTVYVSDGTRLSEWFPGQSVLANTFVANSDDKDSEAKGKLSGSSVKGTIKLPDGKTVRYQATRATGASGLYDLKVSSKGQLEGASAAGVGLTSKSKLQAPGSGTLKFADGKRRKFDVTGESDGDPIRLRRGQVRLIVLPGGQLRGAGQRRANTDGGASDFYIRSTS